jgi:hypothetical protein
MAWRSSFRFVALIAVVAAGMAFGEEAADEGDPFADLPPKEAAVERLLSERGDAKAFDSLVSAARKLDVDEQVILEARFLYCVDRREDAALAALAPEFVKWRDKFQVGKSAIFAVREDWLAVVEYVQSIASLRKGDRDGFKRHITEAFWLSPHQGAAFAPHIERLRMEETMKKVRVDFKTKLRRLDGRGEVALSEVMRDRKALALHFWSPWSRECEEFAADFMATASALESHGIAVASLLAEDDPRVVEDARKFVAENANGAPGLWLRDRAKNPLHTLLRVQSVPVLVLIGIDGRILFNGHPADEECWEALQTVAPGLKRPALEADQAPGH